MRSKRGLASCFLRSKDSTSQSKLYAVAGTIIVALWDKVRYSKMTPPARRLMSVVLRRGRRVVCHLLHSSAASSTHFVCSILAFRQRLPLRIQIASSNRYFQSSPKKKTLARLPETLKAAVHYGWNVSFNHYCYIHN